MSMFNKCNEFLEPKTKDQKDLKNIFMLSNRRRNKIKK